MDHLVEVAGVVGGTRDQVTDSLAVVEGLALAQEIAVKLVAGIALQPVAEGHRAQVVGQREHGVAQQHHQHQQRRREQGRAASAVDHHLRHPSHHHRSQSEQRPGYDGEQPPRRRAAMDGAADGRTPSATASGCRRCGRRAPRPRTAVNSEITRAPYASRAGRTRVSPLQMSGVYSLVGCGFSADTRDHNPSCPISAIWNVPLLKPFRVVVSPNMVEVLRSYSHSWVPFWWLVKMSAQVIIASSKSGSANMIETVAVSWSTLA